MPGHAFTYIFEDISEHFWSISESRLAGNVTCLHMSGPDLRFLHLLRHAHDQYAIYAAHVYFKCAFKK